MTFETAVAFVLKAEGGIGNDPQDTGGLTKWGISSSAFPQANSPNFTKDDAIQIYRTSYWNACRCDELPGPLALVVFDAAVNQGQSQAIRMLQRTLAITPDGIVGAITIKAAQEANLMDALAELIAKRAFAYGCIPTFQRFGLGWMRRLAACHQAALTP